MLISSIDPIKTYVYIGGSKYGIPFPFYGKTSICVSYSLALVPSSTMPPPFTELTYGVDFTVDGEQAEEHENTRAYKYGEVQLTNTGRTKVPLGAKLCVQRCTPMEQRFTYNELDNFPAKSHENALGYLVTMIQEVKEKLSRTIITPPGFNDLQGFLDLILSSGTAVEVLSVLNDLRLKAFPDWQPIFGGWRKDSFVIYNGIVYQSLIDYNTSTPPSEHWREADWGGHVTGLPSVLEMVKDPDLQKDGRMVQTSSFFEGLKKGGTLYVWNSSRNKDEATGGNIIDPDSIGTFNGQPGTIVSFLNAQGTGTGTGCFEIVNDDELRSVTIFGAVGDGEADDTAAVQACFDSFGPRNTPRVLVPKGEFKCTDTIELKQNITGAAGGIITGLNVRRQAETLDKKEITSRLNFYINDPTKDCLTFGGETARGTITVSGLEIWNSGLMSHAILNIQRLRYANIEDVTIEGYAQYGVYAEHIWGTKIDQLRVIGALPDQWDDYGIRTGFHVGNFPNGVTILNSNFSRCNTCLDVRVTGNQLSIIGGILEHAYIGINFSNVNKSSFAISDSYIEAVTTVIKLPAESWFKVGQIAIRDCEIENYADKNRAKGNKHCLIHFGNSLLYSVLLDSVSVTLDNFEDNYFFFEKKPVNDASIINIVNHSFPPLSLKHLFSGFGLSIAKIGGSLPIPVTIGVESPIQSATLNFLTAPVVSQHDRYGILGQVTLHMHISATASNTTSFKAIGRVDAGLFKATGNSTIHLGSIEGINFRFRRIPTTYEWVFEAQGEFSNHQNRQFITAFPVHLSASVCEHGWDIPATW